MANMGYCRFSNTVRDLQDCYDAEGMWDASILSAEEQSARRDLIALCVDIAAELGDEDE